VQNVRAKKNLGQHFLNDSQIAKQIVDALSFPNGCKQVLEVGPGMGILTDHLFSLNNIGTKIIDIDHESINYLYQKYPEQEKNIIEGDFLNLDFDKVFTGAFCVIGNFPYNISSQILFKILDNRDRIPEVVGMFQKEVAERIAGSPRSREYGILSVFMQTWYTIEIILQLKEEDFTPPPKVRSAVLHFQKKNNFILQCDEVLFRKVVKTGFNQRRKTLRNAMSVMIPKTSSIDLPYMDLRAEALSWKMFEELTNAVQKLQPGK
jgi:16S rRNA (adenine1518-N6/adenine1519-N6)-dimethyltransferase